MATKTAQLNKTHFAFPRELLLEIDRIAGSRKRSAFVIDAAKEKLAKERFAKALKSAAGCWTDENHPELRTKKNVDKYIRDLRKSWRKRLKRVYA